MKTILMSIHPKWCKKIFNGEKTIEVRKTAPKPPFKAIVYCTKENPRLQFFYNLNAYKIISNSTHYGVGQLINYGEIGNGKVIGEFICDKIYITDWDSCGVFLRDLQSKDVITDKNGFTEYRDNDITREQHIDYAGMKCAFGLNIIIPKLYDKPKEVSEFFKSCDGCDKKGTNRCAEELSPCRATRITRAPQSWQYIQDPEDDNE